MKCRFGTATGWQFEESQEGRRRARITDIRNSGISSAEHRVTTGDEDATFETEPEDKGETPDG